MSWKQRKARLRGVVLGLGSALLATFAAHSHAIPKSDITERVARVQDAVRQAAQSDASTEPKPPRLKLVQYWNNYWLNWPNWSNWSNWSNY